MSESKASSSVVKTAPAFTIRRFDGKNFGVWRAQVEAYMLIKECRDALTTDRPRNTTDKNKDEERKEEQRLWDEKNNCARAILLLSLGDDQAAMVMGLKTAREMWGRLIDSYEHHSQASRVLLQRDFFDAQMEANEKVVSFVGRVQRIFTQLIETGVKLSEETLVSRIISGLTPKYHVFITQWANNTFVLQTMSELLPRLIAEESLVSRLEGQKGTAIAMLSESKQKRKKPYVHKQKPAATKNPVPNASKSKKKDKSKLACYNCGELGHFKVECSKSGTTEEAFAAEGLITEVEEAFVAEGSVVEALEASTKVSDLSWILDSGATHHMTGDPSNFVLYSELERPGVVRFADKSSTPSLGKGSIRMVSFAKGTMKTFLLNGVLYVPGLRRKLISLTCATSGGRTIKSLGNKLWLRNRRGDTIMEAVKKDGLYHCQIQEESTSNDCYAAEGDESDGDSDIKLWHERLGHVSKNTIAKMKKRKVVEGLEKCIVEIDAKTSDRRVIDCESCCLAKMSRKPIPDSTRERSNVVGGYLHVDICGPISPPSLSKAKYIALFKDEFSNYRFIYFIKTKGEVFDSVRECVAQIRSDTGNSVACLVSDRGSELMSNQMVEYLRSQSIAQKTSAPFTPQQNGFIERENRTVMEMTRSLLYHRKLDEKLWGEAANAAVYILNRLTNRVVKDKTPFERYFGRKPRIDHIRVFGSIAYMKAQEKKRSGYQKKLEPRSIKMVLVGFDRDFTYRLYDPATDKVTVSREVVFDERAVSAPEGEEPEYQFLDEHVVAHEEEHSDESDVSDQNAFEANLASVIGDDEPKSYSEATQCSESDRWRDAMKEEYESLIKNETWVLEKPPIGTKLVRNKWVYKLKRDLDGNICRYKARLVAKGFTQRFGIDYFETFSPVVRVESVRLILSLVAKLDLELVNFDIKTAFLNGKLEEDIWMNQPEGFEEKGYLACKLKRSIYGLKQASRVWNDCFVSFLKRFKLKPTKCDSCVLVRHDDEGLLIIAIYVDDGLMCSDNANLIEQVVSYLRERFDVTLMNAECFVGMEIRRDRANKTLTLSQSRYAKDLVERFEVGNAVSAPTPMIVGVNLVKSGVADGEESKRVNVRYREAVGCLMYLMGVSRPDIAFAVHVVSKFNEQPRLPHWVAVKRILKYIKGTCDYAICYDGNKSDELIAYSDADYASCRDTRKSITGLIVSSSGGPVVWKSSKQSTVVESTTEAEFVACSTVSREVVWLRNFLCELLGKPLEQPTTINVDNQSAIKLVKNNQIHSKIKHLDIRLMAVRERVESREVRLEYVKTKEQTADVMTKALAPVQFSYLRNKLGVALMLCLLLATCVIHCGAWTVLLGRSNLPDEQQHLVLKMANPCPSAELAEKELRGVVEMTEEGKLNTSLITVTESLCKGTYEKKVIPAFEEISGCLPVFNPAVYRNRRDVTSVVGAVSTVASIIVGVTNLIRGSATEVALTTKAETMGYLEKIVEANSKMSLTDKSSRTIEQERELSIVSEASSVHQQELVEVSATVSMMVWTTYHIVNELYAGIANLKAIKKQCALGRLATVELAEMLENRILATLTPRDTVLLSVSVNTKDKEIEFSYKVKREVHITFDDIVIGGSICLGLIVVIVLIGTNLHVINRLSKTPIHRGAQTELQAVSRSGSINQSRDIRFSSLEL